jgi:uncharacterized protein (TIGR00106 family)
MSPRKEPAMLVEFSIHPVDSGHMTDDVVRAVRSIIESKLKCRIGPMGTCVEGDWDTVMAALKRAHDAVAAHHDRVLTTITIDDRKSGAHSMDDAVKTVERRLVEV